MERKIWALALLALLGAGLFTPAALAARPMDPGVDLVAWAREARESGPFVVPVYHEGKKYTDPRAIEAVGAQKLSMSQERVGKYTGPRLSRSEVFAKCRGGIVYYKAQQDRWVCFYA